MTKRRFVVFASVAVLLALTIPLVAMLALDTYLHYEFDEISALNRWGYRGPVLGRKQPNEWRLAVLGESTAFGYGVRWQQAIPAYLERFLNASRSAGVPIVTVVNLAYNGEGAHSYKFTLADFDYIDYDAVLFYSGYNDLLPNTHVYRYNWPIFRLTGYMPIFPEVLKEKAMSLRWGGRLEDAYRGDKTTFKPNITERATAAALETAVAISRSLDTQLARGLEDSTIEDAATAEGAACGTRWAHYCGEMYEAVKLALDRAKPVLLVTQPYLRQLHEEQQRQLHAFLRERFPSHPRLHFANLGDVVNLKDPTLAYDGMHLTATGNRRIAAALESHVRALLE